MQDLVQTDELKKVLQSHFTDGLVTIIGSGLSCAEGLPGMGAIAHELLMQLPMKIPPADHDQWNVLESLLPKVGLEAALLRVEASDSLQALIADTTAELVAESEREVLKEVFQGSRKLRLSSLIPHMLKNPLGIPVITTNYDTLVEVAFEEAGFGVDTMFVGHFAGSLNAKEARASLLREAKLIPGKGVRYRFRDHALVAKPHGSLDWYYREGRPVRSGRDLRGAQRLIIAPGRHKFRSGYESPFDAQRERANAAIDRAARFLIVGYGFNDDHLETHLTPAIRAGTPALLITRDLSDNAVKLAKENDSVIAIDRRDIDARSRVIYRGQSHTLDMNLWDLRSFVEGIFEHAR